ncbi:MAG: PH domain-containing protein [Polynucleobacter sp.]|uniref:PH domain-containing protein n=1 Tax=Limnobacter sp. TaxID=2003368 RepID=UPI00273531DF|nr:PH domain-containing protein [Limnobacter sp.]MDP3271797.1 PH domain-containing protein [Limnobacter sp.]MDZ4056505.1 PH domain-containing protein [Polynucleobacter sp.]
MNTISPQIEAQLSRDEKVLWAGQPKQGVILRGADALMIPFSLMWGGFAIFWELSVLQSDAPAIFVLFGIPFVLIGLYLIVGRFFFDAKQRANTYYGVTDERVIIISGVFSRKIKSLNLRTLSDLSLLEGKGGEGTVSFGGGSPLSSMFAGFAGWPGMEQYLGPRFELIPNAKSVFETIRGMQRVAA